MSGYIFISYAHENTRFASRLARRLKKRGIPVWLDQWHLSTDDEWDRVISNAINNCRFFLVVLSPPAVNSWIIREQVSQAEAAGKVIIPVLYQACRPPDLLADLECIDFTQRSKAAAVDQLLAEYYGEQSRPVKSHLKLTTVGPGLLIVWRQKLSLLLWPVLAILILGITILVWSWNQVERVPSEPAGENLAVVQVIPTPTEQAIVTETILRARDEKLMVEVPAGEFLMGSPVGDEAAGSDEKPQHAVYLDAFWIDETEITNGHYQQCVEAGRCSDPGGRAISFSGAELPVVGVNWEQAETYCSWVGGRLPTEAEWEKAARGSDGRLYPWGDEFDGQRLNFCDTNCVADWRDRLYDDGHRYTAPVGSYPAGASPYGALDMSGNVWEWTADWYSPEAYQSSVYENPAGPDSGQQRVIRGGSWYYRGNSIRAAKRHRDVPTSRYDNIGFRCVVSDAQQTHQQFASPDISTN